MIGSGIIDAALFGALAQSTLILAGLMVYWLNIPRRVVGWLGGFGAGALVSAIAFDLVLQSDVLGPADMSLWLMIGAGIFVGCDYLVEKRFGKEAGAMSIVLGSIVDGVPEQSFLLP